MKKTTIICDGCKKEIAPVLNGAYPKVSISMEWHHDASGWSPLKVSELCPACFTTIREALKTALQACNKDDLPQA